MLHFRLHLPVSFSRPSTAFQATLIPHPLYIMSEAPASPILRLLSALSPPQAPSADVPYDGLEYRWKMILFRPALFKTEGILLAVLGAYMLWFYIGGFISYGRAKKT